jgi:hypothetical protein
VRRFGFIIARTASSFLFEENLMTDRKVTKSEFDLNSLLHPAQAFSHPSDVVNDVDLTLNEKRAILASWASDACAVEAAPALRTTPAGTVRFDDVMDALRALDEQAREPKVSDRWRRVVRRQRLFARDRGGRDGHGPRLQ